MDKIVAAQRTFGLRLLRALVKRAPGENVFLSPLGVFLALHMTEKGSAGATQSAIRTALALPDGDDAVLNTSALTLANALWTDRRFPLDPAFVKQCESLFHAQAASLDLSDPLAAAKINDWVKTSTSGKIESIVTPEAIAGAALILASAVYFAGLWRNPFPISQTQPGTFRLTGGGAAAVPMMHLTRLRGAYCSGENFEGAVLFYRESTVFWYALLPHAGSTPEDVLASLNTRYLAAGPSEFDLELKLPRFSLDYSASLAEPLAKLGMAIAFHYPEADFTPMGSRELFLSDVLHKTRLEVDEHGTVAAAATVGMMRVGAAKPLPRPIKTLVFDRPFVVLIADEQTGALLFAGVVEKP